MNLFIELNEDKEPIVPKDSRVADHFTDSMDGMENAGIQLPIDVVVLDFDGHNLDEEYFIKAIIEEHNPFWVKTVRGHHLYFKKPNGIKFNRKSCLTWIGLQCETLVSIPAKVKKEQTYCHPMVKQFGIERERRGDFDFTNLPELPKNLYPLYISLKRKNQNISLAGTYEGNRNNVMNEHLFLIRSQYDIEGNELFEIAEKINNTMVVPPLEDREIRNICNSVMNAELQNKRGGRNNVNGECENAPNTKKKSFDIKFLRNYLELNMAVKLSYDVITKRYMWENLTLCEDHQVPTYILDQLRHKLNGVTKDIVRDFLDFIMFENKRNIILEKIESVEWDGVDRVNQIYEVLGVTDDFDKNLIKKWMWQSLTLLYNISNTETEQSIGSAGCLVFQGKRGIGKTEFFKYLCSFAPQYFKMGAKLKFENKDTLIEALGYWLVELGEVEGTLKKAEVEDLKNFITCDEDEVRLPYGRGSRKTPRMTSFSATCNSMEFLKDETGNRRFWIVELHKRICRKDMYSIDPLQLWRQIFEQCEVSLDNQGFRLTYEEEEILNDRSQDYQIPLKGEDTVRDIIFQIINGENSYEEKQLTVTEWMTMVGNFKNLTSREVGRVLSKMGYHMERVRIGGELGRFRILPIPKYRTY